MAKGKWTVDTKTENGRRYYRAVRKRDAELFASEGNREYAGDWCSDRKAVEALATYLNDKEEP